MIIIRNKFSSPFMWGCLRGYLYFNLSGEKIYIETVRKAYNSKDWGI